MRGAGVGLADDDDPAVVSRIIVAAAADIGRNDVAGGGQPLGNKGMLVRNSAVAPGNDRSNRAFLLQLTAATATSHSGTISSGRQPPICANPSNDNIDLGQPLRERRDDCSRMLLSCPAGPAARPGAAAKNGDDRGTVHGKPQVKQPE